MPITSTERQKRYRERINKTTARLNVPISLEAKQALEALAERQGITQKRALEQTLISALEDMELRP